MSETAEFRVKNRKGYTVVPNAFIDRGDLSPEAKFWLIYLMSRPEGWEFHTKEILKHSSDGLTAFKSARTELKEHGFLYLEHYSNAEKLPRSRWILDLSGLETDVPETQVAWNQPDGNQPVGNVPAYKDLTSTKPEKERTTMHRSSAPTRRNRQKPSEEDVYDPASNIQQEMLFNGPEILQEAPKKRYGPDTAPGLSSYLRDALERLAVETKSLPGSVDIQACAKHISEWKNKGITPAEVRQMIDLYVSDLPNRNLSYTGWKSFVSMGPDLHARLAENREREHMKTPEAWGYTADEVEEYAVTKTVGQIMAEREAALAKAELSHA